MKGELAKKYALFLHEGQTRPNGVPYVNHILEVGSFVVDTFEITDTSVVSAAYLHDSVEDQAHKIVPCTDKEQTREAALKVITEKFGTRTAELVRRLSNPETNYATPEDKINGYIEHIKQDILTDPDAVIIKLADLFSNAGGVLDLPTKEKRLKAYKKYYPTLSLLLDALSADAASFRISSKVRSIIQERGHAILQLLDSVNRASA